MKTTGVSCVPKFGLLGFWGHPTNHHSTSCTEPVPRVLHMGNEGRSASCTQQSSKGWKISSDLLFIVTYTKQEYWELSWAMKHNSDTIWALTSNAIWFWQKTKSFYIQVMIDVLRQASKACVVKREFSKVSFRGSKTHFGWWSSQWGMRRSRMIMRRRNREQRWPPSCDLQAEVLVKQAVCLAKMIYGTNHAKYSFWYSWHLQHQHGTT